MFWALFPGQAQAVVCRSGELGSGGSSSIDSQGCVNISDRRRSSNFLAGGGLSNVLQSARCVGYVIR